MFELRIDDSFRDKGIPFGVLEVQYPDKSQWRIEDFEALKEQELAVLKEAFADYDRKEVFGENPFNRYFKKYKKNISCPSAAGIRTAEGARIPQR